MKEGMTKETHKRKKRRKKERGREERRKAATEGDCEMTLRSLVP